MLQLAGLAPERAASVSHETHRWGSSDESHSASSRSEPLSLGRGLIQPPPLLAFTGDCM